MLLVNAGNSLFKREGIPPRMEAKARLVAEVIVEAYNRMGLDAFNVGAYDLSMGLSYLQELRDRAEFPFLSANLVDRQGKPLFQPYLIKDVRGIKVAFIGLVEDDLKMDKIPDSSGFTVDDPMEAARRTVEEVRARGAELVVILSDMMERACRRLALKKLPIQVIVGSSRRNKISLPLLVGQTLITHLDRGGRALGRMEIFRDGSPGGGGRTYRVGPFAIRNTFVPLVTKIPDHPDVGPLVAAALKQLNHLQKRTIQDAAASANGCGREYVGVEVCARCHQDRYAAWKRSPHAGAYDTLIRKGRQFDLECLACHTVAYQCSEGEVDKKSIEQFAAVQCESCHGPGSLHASTEGQSPLDKGFVCKRCHTGDRAPDFPILSKVPEICSSAPTN